MQIVLHTMNKCRTLALLNKSMEEKHQPNEKPQQE